MVVDPGAIIEAYRIQSKDQPLSGNKAVSNSTTCDLPKPQGNSTSADNAVAHRELSEL